MATNDEKAYRRIYATDYTIAAPNFRMDFWAEHRAQAAGKPSQFYGTAGMSNIKVHLKPLRIRIANDRARVEVLRESEYRKQRGPFLITYRGSSRSLDEWRKRGDRWELASSSGKDPLVMKPVKRTWLSGKPVRKEPAPARSELRH
jgi:hypothetical protein